MKLILIKIAPQTARSLRELYAPKFETDIDNSRKLDMGSEIAASSSKADVRNAGHHRKYFALLKLAWENMPEKYAKLPRNRKTWYLDAGWHTHGLDHPERWGQLMVVE